MIDVPIFLPLQSHQLGTVAAPGNSNSARSGDRATDMYEDHRDLDAEMTTALGSPGESSKKVWKFRAGAGMCTGSFSRFIW